MRIEPCSSRIMQRQKATASKTKHIFCQIVILLLLLHISWDSFVWQLTCGLYITRSVYSFVLYLVYILLLSFLSRTFRGVSEGELCSSLPPAMQSAVCNYTDCWLQHCVELACNAPDIATHHDHIAPTRRNEFVALKTNEDDTERATKSTNERSGWKLSVMVIILFFFVSARSVLSCHRTYCLVKNKHVWHILTLGIYDALYVFCFVQVWYGCSVRFICRAPCVE